MKPKMLVVLVLIVAFLLLGAAGYYYTNQEKLDTRTGLVGDAVCGNIPDGDGRKICCAEAHKDDIVIACVGGWSYLEDEQKCIFLCVKESNGEVEPGNNAITAQEKCEVTRGEWKTFEDDCADTCESYTREGPCVPAEIDSCDCPLGSCWDGESCRGIPLED